jgi:uracil-DNA glycosylase
MRREGFFSLPVWEETTPQQSRVPKCGACKLYLGCDSPKMPVAGKGRKGFMVIGEAPGEKEDEQGEPFVGPTGQRLQKEVYRFGIDLFDDCWVTNSIICRPPNNAKPSPKQLEYCRPNLVNAIELYKPHTIILLGGPAIQSVISWLWKKISLAKGGVGRWTGWNIPSQELNAWVCPTYHPSFIEREESTVLDTIWAGHLEKAFMHKRPPWRKVPDYQNRVELCTDARLAASKLDKLISTGRSLAFDYETNMLKPESPAAQILCCAVSDGKEAIVFPWEKPVTTVMRKWLKDKRKPKIAANMKFEHLWSYWEFGFDVRGWDLDTMLSGHILDNRKQVSGVKFQAFVKLGQKVYDKDVSAFMKANGGYAMNRLSSVKREKLWLYCGMDALLEANLALVHKKELFDE